MSVEKTGVQCDGCKNFLSCGLIPFKKRVENAKKAGWLIKKVLSSWKHYCPDCKTEHQRVKRVPVNNFDAKEKQPDYWWNKC